MRKSKLARYVKMNRERIVMAGNSAKSIQVRRNKENEVEKRGREIEKLNQQFRGILMENLSEKTRIERSYKSLNVNKCNILIDQ